MNRLLGALAAVLVALPVASIQHVVAESQPVEEPWITDFKDCQTQSRQTAILFLIDESKSLRNSGDGTRVGTDPDHARVSSVKAALTALNRVSSPDGEATPAQRIVVAIDGFGTTYEDHGSRQWTVLDESTIGQLLADADAFKTRTEQDTTDYRQALRGADEAMRRYRDLYSIADVREACQLVVWFTDGAYDTDDKPAPLSEQEKAQIENEICNVGGAADVLRKSNVLLLATGLSAGSQAPDFEALRRIAEADFCGSEPRRGELTEATDPDTLLDAILRPPIGPSQPDVAAQQCPGQSDTCAEISFTVASWMTSFRLLVKSGDGLTVSLVTPNQPEGVMILSPDSSPSDVPSSVVPGVEATAFTSQRSLLVAESAGLRANEWAGDWTIRFEGEGAASGAATLAFIGAVSAAFGGDVYDRESDDDLVLVVQAQDPPEGDVPSDMSGIELDIELQAGKSMRLNKEVPANGRVEIGADEIAEFLNDPEVRRSGRLYATVSPVARVSLPEGVAEVPMPPVETAIRLRTGDGYPLVDEVTVQPRVFNDVTTGTIDATVVGPKEGEGTVTLVRLDGDDATSGFSVDYGECKVPGGSLETTCSWKIEAPETANRDVRLQVVLEASGTKVEAGSEPIIYSEPISFSMTRPLDQGRLAQRLALLIGLFMVVQALLKLWSILEFARFNKLDGTSRLVDVPVKVDREGSVTAVGGGPLRPAESNVPFAFDFHESFTSKNALGLTFAVSRWRAVVFHPTFGVVTGQAPVVTQRGFITPKTGTASQARVDLDLAERWIVAFDDDAPGSPDKTARLILFLRPLELRSLEVQVTAALDSVANGQMIPRLFDHLEKAAAAATIDEDQGIEQALGEDVADAANASGGEAVDAASRDPWAPVLPAALLPPAEDAPSLKGKRRALRKSAATSPGDASPSSTSVGSSMSVDDLDPYR